MPRSGTTKTVPFSTFRCPRPAPSPPSHNLSQSQTSKFARSEGSLLRSHGILLDNGGGFTYDSNAVFRPLKDIDEGSPTFEGYIGLQRGGLRSWSWTRKKWITLQENFLCTSHSKEDTEYTHTLPLNQVHQLYPVESKRFCCAVCTPADTWFLIFNDAATLQTWMTEIQRRCPLLNISSPTTIKHLLHVTYDSDAEQINGLPVQWIESMSKLGLCPPTVQISDRQMETAEIRTPMTEPTHSPVHNNFSYLETPPLSLPSSSSSPSQQRQQRQRQQQQQREQQQNQQQETAPRSMSIGTVRQRSSSHTLLGHSTSTTWASGSGSALISRLNPNSKSGSSPAPTGKQYNRYEQLPDPTLASSASTSTLTQSSRPQRQQPIFHPDLEARDLTGSVQTVHLFPIAQRENCDTWKGKWTGQFGTRLVAIHVLRFTNNNDNNNSNANRPLNDSKLVQKFTTIILHELKALHQLRHPHVVRIRGFTRDPFGVGIANDDENSNESGRLGGVPAVISTWTTYENIMEYLDYTIPVVSTKLRLKLLAQAASGLSYLHTFPYQVLHGSLRGTKIQIQLQPSQTPASGSEQEPVALITGFGFNPLLADEDAKWVLPEAAPSPRWAAPEVIFGGRKEMSVMADVFSFGRCVVEVMTSQQPYHHIGSDADVLSLIIISASTTKTDDKRSSDSDFVSVYYPKPKLKSRTQQQNAHEQETVRTLQRLWPLLEKCWRICPTARPGMDSVQKGLLDLVDTSGGDEG